MNNNQIHERALLGQFSAAPSINLGDPYVKKGTELSRWKKKQFQTEPGHKGRTKDTMFARAFPWLNEGEKFRAENLYIKLQPAATRKKGFLSGDAHRRDEYTNVIRTEQLRWALTREEAMKKLHRKKVRPSTAPAKVKQAKPLAEDNPEFKTPKHLFDVGKGDAVTKFSQKHHRDCWYQSQRDPRKPRQFGDYLPSSCEIGNEFVVATELSKPEYGIAPLIKQTFYRAGGAANAGLPG